MAEQARWIQLFCAPMLHRILMRRRPGVSSGRDYPQTGEGPAPGDTARAAPGMSVE